MQVTLTHKGSILTQIAISTSLEVMLQTMQAHATQLQASLEEIEFEFSPTEGDTHPYVSMIFLVGDNMVIGSVHTPEYSLQREFGRVPTEYKDKNEVVKVIVAELSKAAHHFGNIVQQQDFYVTGEENDRSPITK